MQNSPRVRFTPGQHSAFTLIELLVVIAIISILAAILFPVFAQARERARQTSCLSNLKQIGISILEYNQDFDENYPLSYYQASDGSFSASKTPVSWPRIIQPYLKSTQVFRCPSDAVDTGNVPGTGDTPQTRYPVSYAYNYFMGGNFSPTGILGSTLPETVKAAQTIMLVDGASLPQTGTAPAKWKAKTATTAVAGAPDTKGRNAWLLVHAGTSLAATSADYGSPLARHQERVNTLWADGHAKSLKIENFYTLPGTVPQGGPDGSASCPGIPSVSPDCSPCLEPTLGCKE